MKKKIFISLALVIATTALYAQSSSQPTPPAGQGSEPTEVAPPAPASVPNLFGSFWNAGLQLAHEDTNSSKFTEYRDVPNGLSGPAFRIFSDAQGNPFLISGENTTSRDRRFYVWTNSDVVRVSLLYDQIPHRLGNDAKSPEKIVARDALGISDYIQAALQNALQQQFATRPSGINFGFLSSIVGPLLNTPEVFNLGFQRNRGFLDLQLFPNAAVDSHITYFQENRGGTRSAGTSFGFGNVVETPEPIDFRTRDVGVRLEYPMPNLLLRGSVSINEFENTYNSYTFDNPFRVANSTDPSAYTAPGAGSIGGAAVGRITTPPDNSRISAAIGGIYKLPMNSRLTADLAFGQMRSNNALIPYTTNTAILATVPDANNLPVDRFEGKINTTSANLNFTSHPLPNFNITARYRFYDNDNRAARIAFPGYVRFDAVWEAIPRITVPYSWRDSRGEVLASYDFSRIATVEAGYRNDRMYRTFREVSRTNENIGHIAVDLRPNTWLTWRNSFEFGNRSDNGYNMDNAENATYQQPQPPVNPDALRRFDVMARSTQRIISILAFNPFNGPVDVTASFTRDYDNYDKNSGQLGLLKWRNQSVTLEADYSPTEKWSTFVFAAHEYWDGYQVGRQSGATPSTNPLDNWIADNSDKANTIGAGFTVGLVPNKVDLNLTGRLQRVNGNANLQAAPGGVTKGAVPIPNIDDTNLWSLIAQANYKISTAWQASVGAWYEHYSINDALNTGLVQFLPGGFFLAPDDLGYNGAAVYVTTTYRW